ncbi:MAG TPA: alpha/beta fold hydrolase [Kofleriaceae bacterium]
MCIHGFTGSPYEMRYLGQALAADGMSVRGPALPGHTTSLDDLDRTRWQDWADTVEREVRAMCERHRRVAVVGQSLGGLLALHVAAALGDRISAVASLAAPLWLDGLGGRVATWLTSPHAPTRERLLRWAPRLPKLGGSDVRDPAAKAENPSYRVVPTRALGELLALMPVVDAELPRIMAPVLVVHASHDHTAPVDCALRIARRARARRLRILPRSYHLIAIDVERDLVAAEVREFIRSHTGQRQPRT